jgi:3-oxoadipate enol-lactonase
VSTETGFCGLRQTARLRFWVEDSGGDGEPLLLVSGLGYSSWCWAELRDLLRGRWRVVSFDNRGTGRSAQPAGPYSIAMLADDAASMLEACGVETAHVLGHSMGGYIALTLARRHPQRVRSLVLVSTAGGGRGCLPLPEDTRAAWLAAAGLPPEQYARRTMPLSFAPGWTERHPKRFERYLRSRLQHPTPPACWAAQFQACEQYFAEGVGAEQIAQPALVIHGTADRVIPFANGELLASQLPNARLLRLDGVGHLPYLEEPERFASAVREFLGML